MAKKWKYNLYLKKNQIKNPSFGYSSPLKDLYRNGKLPVKYGFYGDKLTKANVSLEHLLPYSKGGKTNLDNLVLSTKQNNFKRGNQPLSIFINFDNVERYLNQFVDVKIKNFNGNEYIQNILKTIKNVLKYNL